jgi:hypothetical protein
MVVNMELRKQPLMSFKAVSNWPPEWIWTFGANDIHPTGEIGVLENARQSIVNPDTCFLTIGYAGSGYVGRLVFDQPGFCQHVSELLKANYGRPLNEVGQIDIANTP